MLHFQFSIPTPNFYIFSFLKINLHLLSNAGAEQTCTLVQSIFYIYLLHFVFLQFTTNTSQNNRTGYLIIHKKKQNFLFLLVEHRFFCFLFHFYFLINASLRKYQLISNLPTLRCSVSTIKQNKAIYPTAIQLSFSYPILGYDGAHD